MNELTVIENNGQRVLTTAQLAECYETDGKTVSWNFNHNKERFVEGKHFHLAKGDTLKAIREIHDLPKNINQLYLWTEKGALLHAKSLNTDKAWEVYDQLVENYFNPRQVQAKPQMSQLEMIAGIAQGAAELERRTNVLETQVKAVSDKLDQALDVFTEGIADSDWKGSINRKINHVCKTHNLNYVSVRHDMYVELEHLAHCNLNTRVKRKQDRLRSAGGKYREIAEVSKIDVIAEDARLRAIFDGIVKRLEARYIQGTNVQLGMFLEDLIEF